MKKYFLFELIKSLTPSEKGYFKRGSSLHGAKDNVYIQLFDAIDQQNIYDESAIKKKFKDEKFIKQLSVTKNYLYKQILDRLEDYNKTEDRRLQGMINHADILFKKTLFAQAARKLEEAKKYALQNEQLGYLFKIVDLQRSVYTRLHPLKDFDEKMDKLFVDMEQVTQQLGNIGTYRHWGLRMFNYHTQGDMSDKAILEKMQAIMAKPEIAEEERAVTVLSKRHLYHLNAIYYYTIEDHEKAYIYINKMLDLADEYPKILKNNNDSYDNNLYNYIILCIRLRKYEECEIKIKEMLTIKIKDGERRVRNFYASHSAYLELALSKGDFESGVEQFNKFIQELPKYDTKIPPYYKLAILRYGTYLLLVTKQMEEALTWVNKILNASNLSNTDKFYALATEMIIHYELEHDRLLDNRIATLNRFLLKKQYVAEFEKLFLKLFRKIVEVRSKKELKDVLQKYYESIKVSLEEEPKTDIGIFELDILSWIESKLENRPFIDILQEKRQSERE